jgi:hypothetical protein
MSTLHQGTEEALSAVRRSLGIEPGEQLTPAALVDALRRNKLRNDFCELS